MGETPSWLKYRISHSSGNLFESESDSTLSVVALLGVPKTENIAWIGWLYAGRFMFELIDAADTVP